MHTYVKNCSLWGNHSVIEGFYFKDASRQGLLMNLWPTNKTTLFSALKRINLCLLESPLHANLLLHEEERRQAVYCGTTATAVVFCIHTVQCGNASLHQYNSPKGAGAMLAGLLCTGYCRHLIILSIYYTQTGGIIEHNCNMPVSTRSNYQCGYTYFSPFSLPYTLMRL